MKKLFLVAVLSFLSGICLAEDYSYDYNSYTIPTPSVSSYGVTPRSYNFNYNQSFINTYAVTAAVNTAMQSYNNMKLMNQNWKYTMPPSYFYSPLRLPQTTYQPDYQQLNAMKDKFEQRLSGYQTSNKPEVIKIAPATVMNKNSGPVYSIPTLEQYKSSKQGNSALGNK